MTRLLVATGAAVLLATGAAVAQDFFRSRDLQPYTEPAANQPYDGRLVFVRLRYPMGFGGFGGRRRELPWAHDYPTADIHMMKILNEISIVRPRMDGSNVFPLEDPELHNFPIAYMSEPGFWSLDDKEAAGLRSYLLKGGFIIFDDFRAADWENLQEQMRRALPDGQWVLLEPTHPIFNSFFQITRFDFGYYGQESYYGMFENNDPRKRLMAIAGQNQDLGEYWEYSDTGLVPVDLSNEAYKFGVNYFIYGLTH
jgi:hypothetical protein